MKRLFLLLTLALITTQSIKAQPEMAEVKINVMSGVIAILNTSLETSVGYRTSFAVDYVGAFAKENYMGTGYPLIVSIGVFEYRYYLRDNSHSGFFVGGDFGLSAFRMNKNIVPLVANDKSESGYDVGFGYFLGASFGYKYPLGRRWSTEFSFTAGWQRSLHEGYNANGVRSVKLNPSAEWLPYKAGIYLNYKLWE